MLIITSSIFPDYIRHIADELALSYWDWSAIILSLVSLLIAILSFLVARRTLISQKRTEKNTSPIINKKVQLFLLNNSLRELYESLISITALYAALEHTSYKIFPSRQFWHLVYIDTSNLHEELFYGDDTKFQAIYYLKTSLNKFNSDVLDLDNDISKSTVTSQLKKTIILHICEDIGNLVQVWGKCYMKSLGLTKYEMLSLLEDNFFKCNFCRFNHIKNDDKDLIKYYLPNTPFDNMIEEIVELLSPQFETLRVLFNLDYDERQFKMNISHFVDLLMLNVLYRTKPFAAYIIQHQIKSRMKFESSNRNESNIWTGNEYTPKPNMNYSWIFYFNDIQK